MTREAPEEVVLAWPVIRDYLERASIDLIPTEENPVDAGYIVLAARRIIDKVESQLNAGSPLLSKRRVAPLSNTYDRTSSH